MLSRLAPRTCFKTLATARPLYQAKRHKTEQYPVDPDVGFALEGPEPERYPYQQYEDSGLPLEMPIKQKMEYWKEANEIFFGPQRDMKNFPTIELPNDLRPQQPKLNFLCIPSEWFKPIYERIGVTGCYTLPLLTVLAGISTEWIPASEFFFCMVPAAIIPVYMQFLEKNAAPKLDKKAAELDEFNYFKPLREAKVGYEEESQALNAKIATQTVVPEIFEAKKEQVDLQLELEYRERVDSILKAVKTRLDYQAARDDAQRKFDQELMVTWIVNNVQKAISPQHEKDALTGCIADLRTLSKTTTL